MADSTALADDVTQPATVRNLPTRSGPRRRRLLLAATLAVVVAVVAVGLGLASGSDGRRDPGVPSVDDEGTTTTVAGETATTVAPAAQPTLTTVPTAGTTPTTAAAPKPAPAPDRSRPAGATYTPEAVWPETVAELDRVQAAVDQGHQPWRNDPAAVARAYLADRGLPTPGLGPFRSTVEGVGSVDYTVAGMGGRVDLQRLLNGSIWFVSGSRSATFPGVQIDRRGSSVAVTMQTGADGTVTARAKRPGGDWGGAQPFQTFVGATRSTTLDVSPGTSKELIVQLRLEGGGKAGVAETYLGPGTAASRYSALDSESRLRLDGLGPVTIGMNVDEARAVSGLPMVWSEGGECRGYRTDGPPAGVHLTSATGTRVDFISVSEPSIATLSGIRVGSTLADVRRTYGDRLQGSVQADGWGRLLFRAQDPSLDHLALVFLFSEGKVAGMWAGLRSVVQADEVCA
jgi:hypothetical protein